MLSELHVTSHTVILLENIANMHEAVLVKGVRIGWSIAKGIIKLLGHCKGILF